jgi:HEPN domain-containing protein
MEENGNSWLLRLSAEEWLRSAHNELQRATQALLHKQQRAGVTQARRAAGMAWNAVLHGIADADERARYGRSYMDHLRVLSSDDRVSMAVRDAAGALVTANLEQDLVQLGAGDTRLARAAEVVVEEAQRRFDGTTRS